MSLEVLSAVRTVHFVEKAEMRGNIIRQRLIARRHQNDAAAGAAPVLDIAQHTLVIGKRCRIDVGMRGKQALECALPPSAS